jgi:hypothetical protein
VIPSVSSLRSAGVLLGTRVLPVTAAFTTGFAIGTLANQYILHIGVGPPGDEGASWANGISLSSVSWAIEAHDAGDQVSANDMQIAGTYNVPTLTAPYLAICIAGSHTRPLVTDT